MIAVNPLLVSLHLIQLQAIAIQRWPSCTAYQRIHGLKIERHDMSVHFVAPDAYLGSYYENKHAVPLLIILYILKATRLNAAITCCPPSRFQAVIHHS